MFDEFKEVKYFKEKTDFKSLLHSFLKEQFCKNTSLIFNKKLRTIRGIKILKNKI